MAEASRIEHGQARDQISLDKRTHNTEQYDPKGDVTLLDAKNEPADHGLPPRAPSPSSHATQDTVNIYDRPLHPARKN